MDLNKKALYNLADEIVNISVNDYVTNDNEMTFFAMLTGIGSFRIESFPGAGHNYRIVLDSIYKYYNAHPESNIDKMLFDTLKLYISICANVSSFGTVINYISTHIENEKSGRAPFAINNLELLRDFKNRLAIMEEMLKEQPGYKQWLDDTNNYINDNFGNKVL